MQRSTLLLVLVALSGCQSQNPFAVFGPSTVPPPAMQGPRPYYPPGASTAGGQPDQSPAGAGASAALPAAPSSGTLSSGAVSAAPATEAVVRSTVAEPSDRQPIRIVENAGPAARTAAVPQASGSSALLSAPAGSGAPGGNPPAPPPSLPRTRGFQSSPGSGDQGTIRIDPSVKPARYAQPTSGISAAPASSSGWKTR